MDKLLQHKQMGDRLHQNVNVGHANIGLEKNKLKKNKLEKNGLKKIAGLPQLTGLLLLLLIVSGCRPSSQGAEKLAEDSAAAGKLDSNLTFQNIVLEQPDEKGQTLWKVRAATTVYTPDKKMAQVTQPDGQIFQDGKPIYRIKAESGEVRQDGKKIFLRGQVFATDVKNGAVLQGDELEWQPQKNLLVLRRNIRGSQEELKMSANQMQVDTRKRQVQLEGKVVAIAPKSNLKLQAEKLLWLMEEKKVTSDQPILAQQLSGNKVTNQANSDKAEVNLATKSAHLTQNARLIMQDPALQVTGNSLLWNLDQQTLKADAPVNVLSRQQQVTITADSGRMEFEPRIAYFNGNVQATGEQNRSKLTTDHLTWNIQTQRVEAEGNVVYTQAANPQLSLRGPRAVGKLENRVVVVSGGRVTTEVIPERMF